jgi:hypothetical protein
MFGVFTTGCPTADIQSALIWSGMRIRILDFLFLFIKDDSSSWESAGIVNHTVWTHNM